MIVAVELGYLFYKSNPRKANRKPTPIFIGSIQSFVKINRRPSENEN
jgi:hypothetical protein